MQDMDVPYSETGSEISQERATNCLFAMLDVIFTQSYHYPIDENFPDGNYCHEYIQENITDTPIRTVILLTDSDPIFVYFDKYEFDLSLFILSLLDAGGSSIKRISFESTDFYFTNKLTKIWH